MLDANIFPHITLEELTGQAALLRRVDRKYMVSLNDVPAILTRLAGLDARILDIDGTCQFRYVSDYYDTNDFSLHNAAATKRRRRYKIRERFYIDSGLHYIEVKTRGVRGNNVKERHELNMVGVLARKAMWSGADVYTPVLSETQAGQWAGHILEKVGVIPLGAGDSTIEALTPCLRTAYTRATFLLPESSRLTLDVGLRTIALRDGGISARAPFAILETKSGGNVGVADRLLWDYGIRPRKISKYGVGVAIAYGERYNKWVGAVRRMDSNLKEIDA